MTGKARGKEEGWRKWHMLRSPPKSEHVCYFRYVSVNVYEVLSRCWFNIDDTWWINIGNNSHFVLPWHRHHIEGAIQRCSVSRSKDTGRLTIKLSNLRNPAIYMTDILYIRPSPTQLFYGGCL